MVEAVKDLEQERIMEAHKEHNQFTAKARHIEATEGRAARDKFEAEYKLQKEKEAVEFSEGLYNLKRDLLRQGICPVADAEGVRQVQLYETGLDLATVDGTPFAMDQRMRETSPEKSSAVINKARRQVIACITQDLESRGLDPVEHFQKHPEQTERILDLEQEEALGLLQQYKSNLEQYGQITVPKPGEKSVKEIRGSRHGRREAARAARQRARAERRATRVKHRAQAHAERIRRSDDRNAAKRKSKENFRPAAVTTGTELSDDQGVEPSDLEGDPWKAATPVSKFLPQHFVVNRIAPVAGAFVVFGGGSYALKLYREGSDASEEERRRQLKLLMEGVDPPVLTEQVEPTDSDENDDDNADKKAAVNESSSASVGASPLRASTSDPIEDISSCPTPTVPMEPVPPTPNKRKRRLGINPFAKKKGDRETDLTVLVSEGATAPEFATLLAKVLSYGAPGRFPEVAKLPGNMPLGDTFDLDSAKVILSDMRESLGLSQDKSAEVFANVVNCMLIDIVDLASSSLKENDDDLTVKSINIVIDFMNHAASLYDSIAKGVAIKPVTYDGNLAKSKLEQMFCTFAVAGTMKALTSLNQDNTTEAIAESNVAPLDDDFDGRVALLQDVFQINEKKAEGLMMKAVQKKMMRLMKDGGKGLEGLKDIMGDLGGLGNMMGGDMGEDGPSPEQLKEMLLSLKQMKESGQIPESEFETIRQQFKEGYGSSLEDAAKEAGASGELTDSDKELLQLMKDILG